MAQTLTLAPVHDPTHATVLRCRWREQGAHVHVRVFIGPPEGGFAMCGELTFRTEEWNRLLDSRSHGWTGTAIQITHVEDI